MEYLSKLFGVFCAETEQDEDAEEIRRRLSETLDKEQRKMLLFYADALYAHCEKSAYRSFVEGFRLAAGIAAELRLDQTQAQEAAE